MLSKYIQLKFSSIIVPNSLMEKQHGGVVALAGVPANALNIEFEALRLSNNILGYDIGGALDANGEPIKGVYQVCWWNNPPQNKNSNNTKRTKHP